MGRTENHRSALGCLILLVSLMASISSAQMECGSGYEYNQRFYRCTQTSCKGDSVPDAHLSYVGDCVCGSSGSINENPEHPNKECSRPADYSGCPSCVYACVHLDEPCPDEKPPATTTIQDDAEPIPEYGVFERGGKLFINSPPGETLDLKMSDLPEWARPQMVMLGAMVIEMGPPSVIVTGDPQVNLDGLPVVRKGDYTDHGGQVSEGSERIFINGVPAAFQGGYASCPRMTALPGITTSFNPHIGGRIEFNCKIQLIHGKPDSEGYRNCIQRLKDLETRADSGYSLDRFCQMLKNKLALTYPGRPEYGFAATAYTQNCRNWHYGVTDKPAKKGSKRLELQTESINPGDTILIGHESENSEQAKVVGKGSLILEQPLKNDYPVGTLITRVPEGYVGQLEGDFGDVGYAISTREGKEDIGIYLWIIGLTSILGAVIIIPLGIVVAAILLLGVLMVRSRK